MWAPRGGVLSEVPRAGGPSRPAVEPTQPEERASLVSSIASFGHTADSLPLFATQKRVVLRSPVGVVLAEQKIIGLELQGVDVHRP